MTDIANMTAQGFFAGKGANGLVNRGNTCYINTSVQCLGHCTNFLSYVLAGKYERRDGLLLNELRDLFVELWVNNNGVSPNKFLGHLARQMKNMRLWEQNDIQEFVMMFVDKINASVSERVDPSRLLAQHTYSASQFDTLRRRVDNAWYKSMSLEWSPLVDFFYGQTIHQIKCGNCGKLHHTYEPFSILLLPVPPPREKPTPLQECVDSYLREVVINSESSGDAWRCDACKEAKESQKITRFWRTPKVLMIGLKRFTHDLRKNNTPVMLPETLDMSSKTLGPAINTKYRLASVACHVGIFSGGHYYAVCKNPDGRWMHIDDESVGTTKAPHEHAAVMQHAYMAFYMAV